MWSVIVKHAEDAYWQARRDGKTEGQALRAALDEALADQPVTSISKSKADYIRRVMKQ